MKGFVPTPDCTVDLMVGKLFLRRSPKPHNRVLDPGCGSGAFIEGVIRWCDKHGVELPRITGIESDPKYIPSAILKFESHKEVEIVHEDFLSDKQGRYDYIVGNPPYVPITKLSEEEKSAYRQRYRSAEGRFDLYILFFEQALRCLKKGGRLVFITPEKYMYTASARSLRAIIGGMRVEEIHQLSEETFGDLVTYPTVTTILKAEPAGKSRIVRRDGKRLEAALPSDGSSWMPNLHPNSLPHSQITLQDATLRVSCGVATGADSVFILRTEDLDEKLVPFAFPIVSGRDLGPHNEKLNTENSILAPYTSDGELMEEESLGHLGEYLSMPSVKTRLMDRTCARKKPWYAYHDNFPLQDMLVPKILCKDITQKPHFWIDRRGKLIPRHSVYYIVPKRGEDIERLCSHLNSDDARKWLESNCQRAANGFIRLQSNNLKRLPIPQDVFSGPK